MNKTIVLRRICGPGDNAESIRPCNEFELAPFEFSRVPSCASILDEVDYWRCPGSSSALLDIENLFKNPEIHLRADLSSVVLSSSRVVGFVSVVAENPWFPLAGDDVLISDIVVTSSQRRRGVGRILLNHVVRSASALGLNAVFLLVEDSNKAARRLYAQLGFSLVADPRM